AREKYPWWPRATRRVGISFAGRKSFIWTRVAGSDGVAHGPVRLASIGRRALHRIRRLGDAPPVHGHRRGAFDRAENGRFVRRKPHGKNLRRRPFLPRFP